MSILTTEAQRHRENGEAEDLCSTHSSFLCASVSLW
jgi:hypothetical protein